MAYRRVRDVMRELRYEAYMRCYKTSFVDTAVSVVGTDDPV